MENQKPGWKTTEFWLTLGATVLPFLAATGIISNAEIDKMQESWVVVVQSISAAVVAGTYIVGRAIVKFSGKKEEIEMMKLRIQQNNKD